MFTHEYSELLKLTGCIKLTESVHVYVLSISAVCCLPQRTDVNITVPWIFLKDIQFTYFMSARNTFEDSPENPF